MGFLHDNEGIGVDLRYQILQLRHLLFFYGGQYHLCVLAAVAALTVEVGCATIQLGADLFRDLLIMGRDDQCHLGVVEAVDYPVNDLAGDKNSDSGVQCLGYISEHNACQYHDHHIETH